MSKRDYLRSLGFNVGERGRLTPAMITALQNYVESEPQPISYEVELVYKNYVSEQSEMIRKPRTLYGRTREGKLVSFVTCRACDKHMSNCSCQNGILAPIMVIATKEEGVVIDRQDSK